MKAAKKRRIARGGWGSRGARPAEPGAELDEQGRPAVLDRFRGPVGTDAAHSPRSWGSHAAAMAERQRTDEVALWDEHGAALTEDAPSWHPLVWPSSQGESGGGSSAGLGSAPFAGIRLEVRDTRPYQLRVPNAMGVARLLVLVCHRRSELDGNDWAARFLGALTDVYGVVLGYMPCWGASARVQACTGLMERPTLLRFPPGWFATWEWVAGPDTGDPVWSQLVPSTPFVLHVSPPHDPPSGVEWRVSLLSCGNLDTLYWKRRWLDRVWAAGPRLACEPVPRCGALIYDGDGVCVADAPPAGVPRFAPAVIPAGERAATIRAMNARPPAGPRTTGSSFA